LEPTEPKAWAKADMLLECIRDFETMSKLSGFGWTDKVEGVLTIQTAIAKWFPRFEQSLVGPFLLGDKSYAVDFVLLNSLLYVEEVCPKETLAPYPKLVAFKDHLSALPQIKAFLSSEKRKGLVDEAYMALVKAVFF